jgi:hypothetical protein
MKQPAYKMQGHNFKVKYNHYVCLHAPIHHTFFVYTLRLLQINKSKYFHWQLNDTILF